MRYTTSILLAIVLAPALACVGCGRPVDFEAAAVFQQAQKAFDQAASPEDFLKVAAMYQSILDRGIVSGAVLYNQGNAMMRADQRGRAIAAYREALRYRPTDPYLEANLRYALGEKTAGESGNSLIGHVLFWQNWISYPGKFHLAGAAAAVTLLLGLAALFLRRRAFAHLAVGAGVLTLIFGFSAGYDWYRFDHCRHGVIVEPEVIALKGNAPSYEPAFTEPLGDGAEFELVDRRGDWLLVRLPGDKQGWVKGESAAVY